MIKWAENDKVIVYFDDTPHVSIRYALPSMTDQEIKSVKKYPFVNKKNLRVQIVDKLKDKTYQFDIPKGRNFDGATINRFFWRIIGAPTDNSFLIGALCHDEICLNKQYVGYDRELSTEVFNALLATSKVGKIKRSVMCAGINIFQKFFCSW